MYSSYSFSTWALDSGEWSASRPGRALPQGKGPPVPIVQEAGWAPEPVWTQRLEEEIFCLCRGSNLDRPVVQSVAWHYTDWATPAPNGPHKTGIKRLRHIFLSRQWTNSTTTPWKRFLLEKLTVRSASKDIPCLLRNPKVYYRVHKTPSPVPDLSHMNPIHTIKPYFPKIYFTILPSTPRSTSSLFQVTDNIMPIYVTGNVQYLVLYIMPRNCIKWQRS
jgi:hypothetical protein